jgi:hypothetical protein
MKQIFRFNGLASCFLLSFVLLSNSNLKAQEIGYNLGVNKLGIQAASFQPVYGFSIGYQLGKNFALETNLIYSQRTRGSQVQSDYLSFVLMPKLGLFNNKFGVYIAPSILLNPSLDHSNNQNHTYLSTFQALGGQINLRSELIIDAKIGYDIGLTGGFFDNGQYQKYNGPMILLGMKLKINSPLKD